RDADVAGNLTVLEQLVLGPCSPGLAADPDLAEPVGKLAVVDGADEVGPWSHGARHDREQSVDADRWQRVQPRDHVRRQIRILGHRDIDHWVLLRHWQGCLAVWLDMGTGSFASDDELLARLQAPPDLCDGVESLAYWRTRLGRLPWYRRRARREASRMI